MFENTDLDYYYTLTAPSEGGTAEMDLVTGHKEDDLIKTYNLKKHSDKDPIEVIFIYPDGLIIFTRTQPHLIEIYSNKEFILKDDGKFLLASN